MVSDTKRVTKNTSSFQGFKKFGIAKKRLWWLTAFHILKLLYGWIHLPIRGKKPVGPREPSSHPEALSSMGHSVEAAAPWSLVRGCCPAGTAAGLPPCCRLSLTFWPGTPESSYWRLHRVSGYWVHIKLYWIAVLSQAFQDLRDALTNWTRMLTYRLFITRQSGRVHFEINFLGN